MLLKANFSFEHHAFCFATALYFYSRNFLNIYSNGANFFHIFFFSFVRKMAERRNLAQVRELRYHCTPFIIKSVQIDAVALITIYASVNVVIRGKIESIHNSYFSYMTTTMAKVKALDNFSFHCFFLLFNALVIFVFSIKLLLPLDFHPFHANNFIVLQIFLFSNSKGCFNDVISILN